MSENLNIILPEKTKTCENPGEVFVQIDCDFSGSIDSIAMTALYYKDRGFKKFLINCTYEEIKKPLCDVSSKLKDILFELIDHHNCVFGITGVTKYIFETYILPDYNFYEYENNLFLVEEKKESIWNCSVQKSSSLSFERPDFLKGFYKEVTFNENSKNAAQIFCDEKLCNDSSELLDYCSYNFKNLRKRVLLHESFEGEKKAFSIVLYNSHKEKENIQDFLRNYIDDLALDELSLSREILITLRNSEKSIYFSVQNLGDEIKEQLKEKLQFENNDFSGIYYNGAYNPVYTLKSVRKDDLTPHINSLPLDCKKKVLRFLNGQTKPLNHVRITKFQSGESIIEIMNYLKSLRIKDCFALLASHPIIKEEGDLFSIQMHLTPVCAEEIEIVYQI